MSSAPDNRSAQTPQAQPAGIPIVLPRLIFRAQNDDQFTLTIDGTESVDGMHGAEADPGERTVRRAELGATIARVAERTGAAVRVEIHEHDGGVHADIVDPPPRTCTTQGIDGVIGPGGFLSGEPVLVAVVVQTVQADQDGRLHLPLAPPSPPTGAPPSGRYVLVGAVSHNAAVRRMG